jgi:hypothetical protein
VPYTLRVIIIYANLFQARPVKRYLNQLTHAKSLCEKRLHRLGWMGYPVEEAVEASTMITKKVTDRLCKE